MAKNTQLKRNLQRQTTIEEASDAQRSIKVIFYFTRQQLNRVTRILKELKLLNSEDVVLVDARNDNKPPGSKA